MHFLHILNVVNVSNRVSFSNVRSNFYKKDVNLICDGLNKNVEN